jgi:hypothetical protein
MPQDVLKEMRDLERRLDARLNSFENRVDSRFNNLTLVIFGALFIFGLSLVAILWALALSGS